MPAKTKPPTTLNPRPHPQTPPQIPTHFSSNLLLQAVNCMLQFNAPGCLPSDKVFVFAATPQQSFMSPYIGNLLPIEHHNLVGVLNCAQPMGNNHNSSSNHCSIDC
mmetsp:Transcript_49281/g.91284  ORF Transcript_49281/g.91284 Transcript_49281/m.91284 type:complete len:106 (+) Transcript_49281:91-408(+)